MTDNNRNVSICEQFHILVQANSQVLSFLQRVALTDNHGITEDQMDDMIKKSLMASSIFMHRLIINLLPADIDMDELMDTLDVAWQKHTKGADKMAEVDKEIKKMMGDNS